MAIEQVGKPDFVVEGEVYGLLWGCGIRAEVERLAEHRDELTGEVTIYSRRQPNPGLLHSARLNLMSTQSRKTLAGELQRREPDLDWSGLVEQLCFMVRERYRAGQPSIDMREFIPMVGPRWLHEPFVERDGAALIFADGGTGKTMLAMAVSASVSTGQDIVGHLHGDAVPVLYVDYEGEERTFHERLRAICVGAGIARLPPIFYRRQVASLAEAASELRREVRRVGAGLVIVDSLGAARGGEPESADITIRTFIAARSLGVPWLALDHVTKAKGNDATKPFGSVFSVNLARLVWGMDKAQDEDSESIVVALRNTKRNNGRFLPRIGLRIGFECGTNDELRTVRFTHVDLNGVAGLAEKLPLKERILGELRGGPSTQTELAQTLGTKLETVSARVGELVRSDRVVRLEDRRVALKARPV